GKTTILRHLAGLERPDAGTIAFDDEVWCDTARGVWRPPQARRVGVVVQQPALFPHLTVAENTRYGLRLDSDTTLTRFWNVPEWYQNRVRFVPDSVAAVAEIATILGIADLRNRYPRELSGGEAQ